MKKILALAALAGALSSCVISIEGGGSTPVALTGVGLSAKFQSTGNTSQYYICGNKTDEVQLNISYTGNFTSYKVVFVGVTARDPNFPESNPDLVKGPFSFSTANGDTSASIIRVIPITTNDVKPNAVVRTQAVIVTPIPPQSGNELGIGAFRARVEMTGSNGVVTLTSAQEVRVLSNTNSNCQ